MEDTEICTTEARGVGNTPDTTVNDAALGGVWTTETALIVSGALRATQAAVSPLRRSLAMAAALMAQRRQRGSS